MQHHVIKSHVKIIQKPDWMTSHDLEFQGIISWINLKLSHFIEKVKSRKSRIYNFQVEFKLKSKIMTPLPLSLKKLKWN